MITDKNPESRVSLIAITEERKVLLKRSPDRWSNLLTVPGKKIEFGKKGIHTLKSLLEDLNLTLLSEPEFLPDSYPAIDPKQFFKYGKESVHMIFHEYFCLVNGTPKEGKFYDRYRILDEGEKYYEKNFVEDVDMSLLVEEITYQTLMKYADHIFRNHQPK